MRTTIFVIELCSILFCCTSLFASEKDKDRTFIHFIMNGQSLSTGHQSYPVISTEHFKGNYMLGNQVWINYGNTGELKFEPLVGTVSEAFAHEKHFKSRRAGTIAECPLLGAVNHLRLKQPKMPRILATSVGVSGASVEELSKESETRTAYKEFVTSLQSVARIAAQTDAKIICPAIFWMQGEFNYDPNPEKGLRANVPNTTEKREYKKLLVNIKNNMQKDIQRQYGQTDKPVFITYQTGAQYMRDTLSISMAQLEAANEYDDIICAGPIYPMTDRGGHLDSNGYRWFGEMLGKVYYQSQVQGKPFQPLQPTVIARETLPTQIRIKYHVSVRPLVFDVNLVPKIKDYGFEIYLRDYRQENKQIIKQVEIDGDDVVLTCEQPLVGDVIVVYAGTRSFIEDRPKGKDGLQGHGNLRDSDPYKAFFKYEDLDEVHKNGTFIHPRDSFETRLRPDYEPRERKGKVIYGKKYPLYNFSVGFYYKLPAESKQISVLGN
jgi:hypothetical protein